MKNKIIRLLTNNIALKILAVFFSLILWLLVVNVDDPNKTKSFTVSVQVINEDVLTEQGKYYTIADEKNTVTFSVTARRSIMDQLTASDFNAIADMNDLENDSRIPVEITANRYTNSISIGGSTKYLNVEIKERVTTKFIIEGRTTGTVADSYAISNVEVTPNVITVSGPADIVAQIDTVVAVCSVDGINSSISESVVPTLLNSYGDVVNATGLTLSESTVTISVSLLFLKDVNVEARTSGELGEGMRLESITLDPNRIQVMGDASVLNSMISVVIPGEVIDLSAVTGSFTTTVDITSYLPEGVSVSDNSSARITITVNIIKMIEKTFTIKTSSIGIVGLSDENELKFEDSSVLVSVNGPENLILGLTAADLAASIDVSALSEGTHEIELDLELPEEVTTEPVSVTVIISKKETKTADDGDQTEDEDGNATDATDATSDENTADGTDIKENDENQNGGTQ